MALAAPVLLLVPAVVHARIVLPVLLLRAGRVRDVRDGDGARGVALGADAASRAISWLAAACAVGCRSVVAGVDRSGAGRGRRCRRCAARRRCGAGRCCRGGRGAAGVFAAMHASTHAAGAAIIGSSGAVTRPSIADARRGVRGARRRPAPCWSLRAGGGAAVIVVLLCVTLAAGAGARGARRPARRGAAQLLHAVQDGVPRGAAVRGPRRAGARAGRRCAGVARPARVRVAALACRCSLAALLAGGRVPREAAAGSDLDEPSLAAGLWARAHRAARLRRLLLAPLADRLLAAPRRPRQPAPVGSHARRDVRLPRHRRQVDPGPGLPYAIVEDVAAVPRDARVDMLTLRPVPPAAVVKNVAAGV